MRRRLESYNYARGTKSYYESFNKFIYSTFGIPERLDHLNSPAGIDTSRDLSANQDLECVWSEYTQTNGTYVLGGLFLLKKSTTRYVSLLAKVIVPEPLDVLWRGQKTNDAIRSRFPPSPERKTRVAFIVFTTVVAGRGEIQVPPLCSYNLNSSILAVAVSTQ